MLSTVILLAAETVEAGEPAIHPYWVGVIALGLLTALLLVVVTVGGGREHS